MKAINRYSRNRIYLLTIVWISLLCDISLTVYILCHIEQLLSNLAEREFPYERLRNTFLTFMVLDTIISAGLYLFGFKAIYSHRVLTYNYFVWLLLASILTRIILGYFNL
jgi:hypothetical protein